MADGIQVQTDVHWKCIACAICRGVAVTNLLNQISLIIFKVIDSGFELLASDVSVSRMQTDVLNTGTKYE
jgi:hypothetical protein